MKTAEQASEQSPNGLSADFSKLVIDASTAITQADPVVIIDGKPAVRKGDLVVVVGEKCSGKSNLASLLAAACISPTPVGGSLRVPNGLKMIVFDTEQSDRSISRRLHRAIDTAGARASHTDCGAFIYVRLRDGGAETRRAAIERFCKALKPDIVYIDGLAPLFDDFGDESVDKTADILAALSRDRQCAVFITLFARSYALRMIKDRLIPLTDIVMFLTREHADDGIVFRVVARDRDHENTSLSFRVVDDGGRYEILQASTE